MSFRLLGSYDTIAAIDRLIKEAQRDIVIVSPYFKMERKATVLRALRIALEGKRNVTMLIREGQNHDVAWDVLGEFIELGMKVQLVPNLHAKLYWSDAGAVISSLNMLTSSFESSTEAGLVALDDNARGQIYEFIQRDVQPRHDADLLRHATSPSQHLRPREMARRTETGPSTRQSGYCIRCGESVALNPERPFCFGCYGSWAEFENPEYREKVCHKCGENAGTTMARPLCRACYS